MEVEYRDGSKIRELLKKGADPAEEFEKKFNRPDVKSVRMFKAGRNDPCPCGSGKKFKRCCWGERAK